MKAPLLLCSALLLSACQSTPTTETLYIQDKLADCVGVAPMKCMQVRSQPGENWTLFYQQIEGFTFEPGFRYQLEVRTEQLTDVPADASSVRYQLIKVVSKQAVR
ncbi:MULTISPECIES: DUF4377 domain-containing protein [Aeromonas]|uniref:DUF4377 domain-containing protein n=1 Tax=Aeromonas media TaxID=651 RepID=A0A6M4YEL3_AERME|nr:MULTISPECIES: DUF4377 domain-containing protein [Aeromonas]MCE9923312.1 DUF4377 domain-containing protein [Aeromonas media]MDM5058078.1 DUF4377 domain-containing protein [Aeromonas rivipollensis]QJT21732.1 DUF4377 domain-containing protein [Aeromonas media]QYK82289.1 DUF4377 domain-containing protein [Aeromonas media]TNI73370.1 hypothetical protein CF122_05965 [Aeromonas media]